MGKTRNRRVETLTYLGIWLLVISLYILDVMRSRSVAGMSPINGAELLRIGGNLLPFILLFCVNNWILIPRLLFRNKVGSYFLFALLIVVATWTIQYIHFMLTFPFNQFPQPDHNGPRPLMPLPVFLDFIYALLIIGANLAISLLFQRFDDRLERESIMKAQAENQLAYLKAQINPHFYMNMLNNIHGMIEIDPAKAQDMVIEMSNLMRFMLYDSSRPLINLSSEIAFLHNYLKIMKQRYPADKVSVTAELPDKHESDGIELPPLLFLVFIENAFKHGISYREKSFVDVRMSVKDGLIVFSIVNSLHHDNDGSATGIGLSNVKQRLGLLFGDNYTLHIDRSGKEYSVTLSIPAHENKDTSDRR